MAFDNPKSKWNQRFTTPEYVFGEAPNAYLVAQQHHLVPGRLLALADGEGRNSVHLATQGWQVDAFDFAEAAVEKAKSLARQRGVVVNFACADCDEFDWSESSYDNVVGIFFQFAGPDERRVIFERIDRCLKPGGVVLIQGYGLAQLRFNTGGPGRLENLYSENLLADAFPHYTVLDSRTYVAELSEGKGHAGLSALVGFVARKR